MYRDDRNRYNNTKSLQEILSDIVDSPALSRGIKESRAIQAWPIVLGPSVARITTQVKFYKGVLYVNLNSSIIRSELLMHKTKIIESLNREAGGKVVYDLVIR
ncbi:DUF721 domain-containing protein [Alkalitalea saponilacus]|uniref:DUF721 domain-containing protein n=1 Tax=Alkalitalea saponilacus TaxID=889453 RepID=A0A1T5D7F4_9BACT|nr:DUF721 domain-containing protein [Alkalitalea saponilacus]ASB50610.1 hypothetical protein CDL62_16390 [Alkalitalea saponilacus]SKB67644.1 Protein of unknown function [Alkalitalea saponilacus]